MTWVVVLEHVEQGGTPEVVGSWPVKTLASEWRDEWLPAGKVVEVYSVPRTEDMLRRRG